MSTERRYSRLRHQHTLQDLQDWGVVAGTANWWGVIPSVGIDGVMEIGKYIDFHESDDDADDYDYRLTSTSGRLYTSGDFQIGGRLLAQGETNALPTLGYANASTSLVLGYGGDYAYGLLAGVLGTGNAWIQTARFDGTATAYDLALQPLGGGVDLSLTYLIGRAVVSNWNEVAVDSYNALTFGRANSALTNAPATYDNANGVITYDYHGGGYGRQFGMLDFLTGLYTRIRSAGTWTQWNRIAMHSGPNGYLNANGADTWSASGWNRNLRLGYSTASNAIQFYDSTKSWGIGATGGNFYIMNTTSDSSAAPGMSYPLYHDGTYWNCGNSFINAGHFSIPAGYGYYLNGMAGTMYLASAQTLGSFRCGGGAGGYGGIEMDFSGLHLVFDANKNGGFLQNGIRWMQYWNETNTCWGFGNTTTSASYEIYVTGSAYATGTWTASDERKKRDIKTIPYALERVCAMRGVEYRWRPEADVNQDPERYHVGLIAQEVEQVVPEAVLYAADADSYAVDYSGLVGLLIQAVKELKEKVDVLETERRK